VKSNVHVFFVSPSELYTDRGDAGSDPVIAAGRSIADAASSIRKARKIGIAGGLPNLEGEISGRGMLGGAPGQGETVLEAL
jgi:hypothetical protein